MRISARSRLGRMFAYAISPVSPRTFCIFRSEFSAAPHGGEPIGGMRDISSNRGGRIIAQGRPLRSRQTVRLEVTVRNERFAWVDSETVVWERRRSSSTALAHE